MCNFKIESHEVAYTTGENKMSLIFETLNKIEKRSDQVKYLKMCTKKDLEEVALEVQEQGFETRATVSSDDPDLPGMLAELEQLQVLIDAELDTRVDVIELYAYGRAERVSF